MSIEYGADPGFLAVMQPTGDITHKPGSRLPLIFTDNDISLLY